MHPDAVKNRCFWVTMYFDALYNESRCPFWTAAGAFHFTCCCWTVNTRVMRHSITVMTEWRRLMCRVILKLRMHPRLLNQIAYNYSFFKKLRARPPIFGIPLDQCCHVNEIIPLYKKNSANPAICHQLFRVKSHTFGDNPPIWQPRLHVHVVYWVCVTSASSQVNERVNDK